MNGGIIIYSDPKEFLKEMEKLQEAYNRHNRYKTRSK